MPRLTSPACAPRHGRRPIARARDALAADIKTAERSQLRKVSFRLRLALGQIDLLSAVTASDGRRILRALAQEARGRGFTEIAVLASRSVERPS